MVKVGETCVHMVNLSSMCTHVCHMPYGQTYQVIVVCCRWATWRGMFKGLQQFSDDALHLMEMQTQLGVLPRGVRSLQQV
jgi:hypothetical protein